MQNMVYRLHYVKLNQGGIYYVESSQIQISYYYYYYFVSHINILLFIKNNKNKNYLHKLFSYLFSYNYYIYNATATYIKIFCLRVFSPIIDQADVINEQLFTKKVGNE